MRCPGWPCDTEHAINPAIWKVQSEKAPVGVLAERIIDEGVSDVCLTGGEPFMQNNNELHYLCELLWAEDYNIEVFTNGSFFFPDWAITVMDFVMDWKLKGSAEAETARAMRSKNAMRLKHTDCIKFVVKDKTDLDEAMSRTVALELAGCQATFWVGAVWGCISDQEVIDYIKEYRPPWRLNVQVHKHIWPASERMV